MYSPVRDVKMKCLLWIEVVWIVEAEFPGDWCDWLNPTALFRTSRLLLSKKIYHLRVSQLSSSVSLGWGFIDSNDNI